jgi:hypothetical protein
MWIGCGLAAAFARVPIHETVTASPGRSSRLQDNRNLRQARSEGARRAGGCECDWRTAIEEIDLAAINEAKE